MPDPAYLLAGILLAGAVTWCLRAAPFAVLAPLRHSGLLAYLGERMPVGIMIILAVYTLRGLSPAEAGSVVPTAVALVVTIGLHHWRHNATLSIFGGTAVSVALATAIGSL